MSKRHWSRAEKLTAGVLIVAVLAIIVSLVVPEVRRALGLQKGRTTSTNQVKVKGTGNSLGSNNISVNGNGNVIAPSPPAKGAESQSVPMTQTAPRGIAIGHDNNGTATVNGSNQKPAASVSPKHVKAQKQPKNKPAAPPPPDSNHALPPLAQSCPNGVCIGGDNNGTANVYNLGPPPPPEPIVSVCISHGTGPMSTVGPMSKIIKRETLFKLSTDVNITVPSYMFLFDGPILQGSASMDKGHSLIGYKPGYIKGKRDRSFGFRIAMTDMGSMWVPGEELDVIVHSDVPVHLVTMFGGSEDNSHFPEKFVFPCDKS